MHRLEVDVQTGKVVEIPLTAEEIAEVEAKLAAYKLPVPATISRVQCAKQMLAMGLISKQEALGMAKSGDLPAYVQAAIQGDPDAILIEIDFSKATYERANPLLNTLMKATGADDAAIDDFFRAAAEL